MTQQPRAVAGCPCTADCRVRHRVTERDSGSESNAGAGSEVGRGGAGGGGEVQSGRGAPGVRGEARNVAPGVACRPRSGPTEGRVDLRPREVTPPRPGCQASRSKNLHRPHQGARERPRQLPACVGVRPAPQSRGRAEPRRLRPPPPTAAGAAGHHHRATSGGYGRHTGLTSGCSGPPRAR